MMERIIFHIDVNTAFLSWSAMDRLKRGEKIDLRCVPAVIGGDEATRSGIVLARSIVAKKYGIATPEPLYTARKKCPGLIVIPPDFKLYEKCSNDLYNYLCNFSPDVIRSSIDECCLDMTGTYNLFGDPVKLAYRIKDEVKEKFGFTVNIGIGNNRLCAKMASDLEKPDKVHTIFDNEIKTIMWPLPIEDLLMVGKKSSVVLRSIGINTIGDLATADMFLLRKYFKNGAQMMYNHANGIDDSLVEEYKAKNQSISNETTSITDMIDKRDIEKVLLYLSNQVGSRLRKEGYYTRVVTLVLKNSLFESYSHQQKLVNPINTNEDIYNITKELLEKGWKKDPIRLVGIRLSNFSNEGYKQISLFDEPTKKDNSKIQNAMDNLKEKYGSDIIKNARLFDKKEGK